MEFPVCFEGGREIRALMEEKQRQTDEVRGREREEQRREHLTLEYWFCLI